MSRKFVRRKQLVTAPVKCLICGKCYEYHEKSVENCGHYFCLRIARDPCPECKRNQLETSINRWKEFCNFDNLSSSNRSASVVRTNNLRRYLQPFLLFIPLLVHFLIVPNMPQLIPEMTSQMMNIYWKTLCLETTRKKSILTEHIQQETTISSLN